MRRLTFALLLASSAVVAQDPESVLTQAAVDYRNGRSAEASAALQKLRPQLPAALYAGWQELFSQTLLAQARYGDAIEVLTEQQHTRDLNPFQRYNLAIALLNNGRDQQEARTLLDKLGTGASDPGLRDKSNLTLGWHFLQSQQGATAKTIFERVRLNGPFGERALLGMGWAEVAPRGERQQRSDELTGDLRDTPRVSSSLPLRAQIRLGLPDPDPLKKIQRSRFKQKSHAETPENAWRNALLYWQELAARESNDPSVIEAQLALAYAHIQLGDWETAQTQYAQGIQRLEQELQKIQDWFERLRNDDAFFIALDETNEGWVILRASHAWQEAADKERQRALLINELRRQKIQAENYLVAARFGLARLYDRPVEQKTN